jgi:hypothetical protein
VLRRTDDTVILYARSGRVVTPYWMDLALAGMALRPGTALDGEAVIWRGGRLDFGAAQSRAASSVTRARSPAARHPASYACWDPVQHPDPGNCAPGGHPALHRVRPQLGRRHVPPVPRRQRAPVQWQRQVGRLRPCAAERGRRGVEELLAGGQMTGVECLAVASASRGQHRQAPITIADHTRLLRSRSAPDWALAPTAASYQPQIGEATELVGDRVDDEGIRLSEAFSTVITSSSR